MYQKELLFDIIKGLLEQILKGQTIDMSVMDLFLGEYSIKCLFEFYSRNLNGVKRISGQNHSQIVLNFWQRTQKVIQQANKMCDEFSAVGKNIFKRKPILSMDVTKFYFQSQNQGYIYVSDSTEKALFSFASQIVKLYNVNSKFEQSLQIYSGNNKSLDLRFETAFEKMKYYIVEVQRSELQIRQYSKFPEDCAALNQKVGYLTHQLNQDQKFFQRLENQLAQINNLGYYQNRQKYFQKERRQICYELFQEYKHNYNRFVQNCRSFFEKEGSLSDFLRDVWSWVDSKKNKRNYCLIDNQERGFNKSNQFRIRQLIRQKLKLDSNLMIQIGQQIQKQIIRQIKNEYLTTVLKQSNRYSQNETMVQSIIKTVFIRIQKEYLDVYKPSGYLNTYDSKAFCFKCQRKVDLQQQTKKRVSFLKQITNLGFALEKQIIQEEQLLKIQEQIQKEEEELRRNKQRHRKIKQKRWEIKNISEKRKWEQQKMEEKISLIQDKQEIKLEKINKYENQRRQQESSNAEWEKQRTQLQEKINKYENQRRQQESSNAEWEKQRTQLQEKINKYENQRRQQESSNAEWEKQRTQLQEKINKYENQRRQQESSNAEWEKQRTQLQEKINKYENQRRQQESSNAEWEKQRTQLQEKINKYENQRRQQESSNAEWEKQRTQLQEKINKYENQRRQQESSNAEWEKQRTQLQEKINKYENQRRQQESSNAVKQFQQQKNQKSHLQNLYNDKLILLESITRLVEQKQAYYNKMVTVIEKAQQLIKNRDIINDKVTQKQKQEKLKINLANLQNQEKKLDQKLKNGEIDLNSITLSIQKSSIIAEQLLKKSEQLQKIIEAQQQQIMRTKKARTDQNDDFIKFLNQVQRLKKEQNIKLLKLNQELQLLEKKKEIAMKNIMKAESNPNEKYKNLFVGEVLQEEKGRLFIVSQFFKIYPSKKIRKTKLLYSYALMSALNPHCTVNRREHYLVLMKLEKTINGENYIIALYSQRALQPNQPINNGTGFISSVTNEKSFYLKVGKNNQRVTQYNDYYFIFGNSEIRWKFNSNILETNIGHKFRSFDTKQHKNPSIFTGQQNSSSKIVDYEIYEIDFCD